MNIQDKIINGYSALDKIDCELNCYLLEKRRYLVFWNDLIQRESIEKILEYLGEKTNNSMFTEFKTLIVVGKTKDSFKKNELLYFNNVNTYIVFYLINEELGKTYMNDSWIFSLGLNYKKHIRKINEILSK